MTKEYRGNIKKTELIKRLSDKTQSTKGKFEVEVEPYLIHQLKDAKTVSFYILDWWRVNQTIYPNLAKAARAIFCVPAKAAPVERVWSNAADRPDSNTKEELLDGIQRKDADLC